AQGELLRNLGVPRHERLVARAVDDQLECEPFRIRKEQRLLAALAADPPGPEVERLLRADAKDDAVHHPVAGAAGRYARVLEERDVRSGRAELVGVEEVVDGRVVLIDGLLDE